MSEDLTYFRYNYEHDFDEPSTYKSTREDAFSPYDNKLGIENISAFIGDKENHEVSWLTGHLNDMHLDQNIQYPSENRIPETE